MTDIFLNPYYTPMWTAIGSLGQVSAAILAILALLLLAKNIY